MSASDHAMSIEQRAERDLATVERATSHEPKPSTVKQAGTNRDSRDTAPDNGLSDPAEPGQDRDSRDKHPAFELVESGSRRHGVYRNGVDKEDEWICSPLRITAMTRDSQNGEWGRLLVFNDADGNEHRWTCPQSMHAGSGDELRAVLLREGLTLTTNATLRRMVGDYIQRENPEVRARCVSRTGWHGDVFALPRETYGDTETEPVLFQAASVDGVTLGQGGTLAGWIDGVAAPCAGNSRLVLSLCMGFAAPCAGLTNSEGGGVHLRAPSSTGKTTALRISASMYGNPESYARTWRATDNGLEGIAAMHSDMLLVLDEIGQLAPQHAGQVAYMLANGQGKMRSDRSGSPRAIATWRVQFLSAGEIGLADLVTQSGGKMRAGQEVRVIDLPADAGAGLGLFDTVPHGVAPGAFADQLKSAASTHYGYALPAFLNALVADPPKTRETLRALRASIAASLVQPDASGQVRRVADRFALIAAAGEFATVCGLTGWNTGEAESAAGVCFRAWMDARGTAGDSEPAAMLAQVRGFLEANAESRFTRWDAPEEGARTINRAGFRKHSVDGPTFYIERQCFRREVCDGFDHHAVARVLASTGALMTEGDGGRTRKERLPDGRSVRVYVITPAFWDES